MCKQNYKGSRKVLRYSLAPMSALWYHKSRAKLNEVIFYGIIFPFVEALN